MILRLHPSLQVQHDEPLSLLRMGWTGGRYTATLRDAAMRFIELADQLGSERILLDLNSLFDLPVYDQLWISATLLPRALRLPVRQVVVALPERHHYNRQVLEFILRQYQNMRKVLRYPPCDMQFFELADSALDWLTDYSPRVPALLAEWQQALQPASDLAPPPTSAHR